MIDLTHSLRPIRAITVLKSCLILAAVSGCDSPNSPENLERDPKPYSGIVLRLACQDSDYAAAARPLWLTWAARTGAKVEIAEQAEHADLGFIAPPELGWWAEKIGLLKLPESILDDGSFRWGDILAPYRNRLARWGGEVLAVPIGGTGYVLAYRHDWLNDPRLAEVLKERGVDDPTSLTTWDDLADRAEILNSLRNRPTLTDLSADPQRLVEEFFRIAACYDREASSEVQGSSGESQASAAISFQFDLMTYQPRLATVGFQKALDWLVRVQPLRAKGQTDPVSALINEQAAFAILNLRELVRLPRDGRFAWTRLPGRRSEQGINYVPYLAEGTLGVVTSGCRHPEAAFDLLRELGSPERSAEVIAAVHPGIGPFRNEHFDRVYWLPYGYDTSQTNDLASSLRAYWSLDIANPVYPLRGPDRREFVTKLVDALRLALRKELSPKDALIRAQSAWSQLIETNPSDSQRWLRKAAGLD